MTRIDRLRPGFLVINTVATVAFAWVACLSPSSKPKSEPTGAPDPTEEPGPPPAAVADDEAPLDDEIPAAFAAPVDGPLVISRSRCRAAGCTLVFSFSHPMVEASALADADPLPIRFDPPQAGSWSWTSPRQLAFAPAPGALHWGHEVTIALDAATPLAGADHALPAPYQEALRVPYFQAAGKVATWPVEPGKPRLVSTLDHYDAEIGRGAVFLLYDQPVDPAAVAAHVRLSAGGEALPVEVDRPASIARLWSEPIDTAPLVAVRATELPDDGTEVALQFPSRLDADVPESATRNYTVRTSFEHTGIQLDSTARGGRAPLYATWTVGFSGSVSSAEAQERIAIEPKPESMSVWSWGTEVRVSAQLEAGTDYRMEIPAGLTDVLGNELGRRARHRFTAQDLAPALELPSHALVLERAHAELPVRATNLGRVKATVHPIDDPARFIGGLEGAPRSCADIPGVGAPIRAGALEAPRKLNRRRTLELALTAEAKLACIELDATGRGSEDGGDALRGHVLAQLTDLGITAKLHATGVTAWVTRLSDAAPVAGAKVELRNADGAVIARGRTGDDGLVELDGGGATVRGGIAGRAFLVASTRADVAITALSDDRVSQPWQFGLDGEVPGAERLAAAVFTDRGVYRPDETVHLKVIAREPGDSGLLRLPAERRVHLAVADPRGKQVFERDLALDDVGGAHAAIELPAGAAVGRYGVQVTQGDRVATRSFRVEEYRVPTFEVNVASDQQSWSAGDDARVSIQASYLHGGGLGARNVAYSVAREPAPVRAHGLDGYRFRRADARTPAGEVARGETRLDGQGRLGFAFEPSHPAAAGPMRYVVDAHVTDVDRQVYAGRLSRVVHPTDVYVGVRPPARAVFEAGEILEVPVVAVTPDGATKPGVRVTVSLENIEYHTAARLADGDVQRTSRAIAKPTKRCRITTRKAPRVCKLRVRKPGYYRVVARARDARKRRVETGFEITFGGDRSIPWPRFDHERIELIADKASYRPGDRARIAIQSPFPSARGILTIERDRVIEHRPFSIDDDAPVIEVPITDDHAPNVFVSAVLLRGRVHDEQDATGFETGAPAFRVGYTELRVEPAAARLSVNVAPSAEVAAPGAPITVELQTHDLVGKSGRAKATVMVVDEAVLGLTRYRTPDPVAELYAPRPLGVRTAASRLDLPHSRRARREPIFPGGDGGDGFGLSETALDMRTLFESTAFYDPDVVIGRDGKARVTFELPDNLSTFRVMAIVVDRRGRAGSGDAKVVVRKPVMVKPIMPRFAHPGDVMTVEAHVFNGTDEDATAHVSAQLDGLTLTGRASARKRIAAGKSTTVAFPVEVTGRERAVLRFAASLGGHTDIVEVELPLLDPGTRRRIVASKQVNGSETIEVTLPKDRVPGTAALEVNLSSTMLSELQGAVDYLMGYPNGCIEQTTSTAYPLVVLEDLLPDIGIDVDRDKLKEYAEAGVKRLLSFQTTSGGLAYWPGSDDPHAFGTAFGLTALIEAKQRGYDVPDDKLARMADYLEQSLRSGAISQEMPHGGMADADTRALFVMTLGRLGRPQPGYVSALWRKRDQLTPFGLSFLAVAVSEGGGDGALLDPILAEVKRRAVEKQTEAYYEGNRDGGWSMGSPLRTHASALLAYAGTKPSDAMAPKLLTGLLARRQYGLWGNTQENVFGVMAVAKAVGERAGGSAPQMRLAVNDRAVPESELAKVSRRLRRFSATADQLAGEPGAEAVQHVSVENRRAKPMFVTVRATYDVPLTPPNMKAEKHGFAVARRYETLDGTSLEGRAIPLGDLIVVRLRFTADDKNNYVAIADRLPAGIEPLNTNLATTQKVDGRKLTKAEQRGLGVLSYSEVRDSRVAFYADDLPAGTYEMTYLARATTGGTFLRPAANAEAMYDPDRFGSSAIDRVVIR